MHENGGRSTSFTYSRPLVLTDQKPRLGARPEALDAANASRLIVARTGTKPHWALSSLAGNSILM